MNNIFRTILLLVVLAAPCAESMAQTQGRRMNNSRTETAITGNWRLDILSSIGRAARDENERTVFQAAEGSKKSRVLAGVMSLVLPGAGEYYTESYWRAGGFALAEAGLW